MRKGATLAALAVLATGGQAFGQPVRKGGAPRAAPERANTAAAQVAVAQADLFGSMLLSYRLEAGKGRAARLTIATRYERRLVEVDPRNYRVRLLRKDPVKNALPAGALICRSYAPIDAIVRMARLQQPGLPVEVFPPHLPRSSWRAQIAMKSYAVQFDKKGRATFVALRSPG